MKQTIAIIFCAILASSIFGQTKVTLSDGSYSNPNIWSPAGVPNLINTDSLYIAHNITFDEKIIINWDYFEIQPGACLKSLSGLDTISFIDGDGAVKISGSLHAGWFNNQCDLTLVDGQIIAETQFNNLDTIVISPSAVIETYKWYCASGVSYDGQLSCSYFNNNGGNITGAGKICVSDTLRNQGNVGGTIDLCDATPAGSGDYNIGTYEPGVTFCAASPCSTPSISCGTTAINEENSTQVTVFPNPASSYIQIEGFRGAPYVITNLNGEMVSQGEIIHDMIHFESIPDGMYFLHLNASVIKLIKKSF